MSEFEQAFRRVQSEYLEVPNLKLTLWQAHRLWSLEAELCEAVLEALVTTRFLWRTRDGAYLQRRGSAMARATNARAAARVCA